MQRRFAVVVSLSVALICSAAAKNAASIYVPLPPSNPLKNTKEEKQQIAEPASVLFSGKRLPSLGRAMAIGYYPRGCLQGGVELPVTGPTWQVMRVSRNRNWGHPDLVRFLERFAPLAAKATGWHGILVGDMAQPRGGPLPFGHKSHQIGLDVDIWFMPMPIVYWAKRNAITLQPVTWLQRTGSASIMKRGVLPMLPLSEQQLSSPMSSASSSMLR